MTAILNFLTAHMITVLIVLAITVIAVVAFIVLVLRRSQDEGDKPKKAVAASEPMAPVAAVTQAADLELSFRRAMKTLRGFTAGSGYRYRIPWYMLLGPVDSGNSTLMRKVPLPRRVRGRSGASDASYTVDWHFFDAGIVLDVTGSVVLKKDLSSDEVGWKRVLALLKRNRPERPIDGVVLTISAADLRAWREKSKEDLREFGSALFRKLREAQAELGVRFPVYVLLTQADRLPGFSSFVGAVPRRFHQDIFGWSNPYALDTAFREEWIDEALDGISHSLRDRSTEVLASRTQLQDADAVFRFPDVTEDLRWATRTVLAEVFDDSAYHESFFLRGVYLSGMLDKEAIADSALPSGEVEAGQEDESAHEESVFASRLFTHKIFPERGLARGFAKGLLDRNRTIRWIQIAAVLLVMIGLPGMYFAQADLRREARPLEELLDSIGQNLQTMVANPDSTSLDQFAKENAVLSLLSQMSSLNANPFRSVFLPTSWFAGVNGDIEDNLTEGFQDVILPTLRTGIIEWARDTLTDNTWATTLGGRIEEGAGGAGSTDRFQEYEVLVGYLSDIRQLEENAERFNRLSGQVNGDMQAFADLFFWYYEEELPEAFLENDALYGPALVSASERPVSSSDWPDFEAEAAETATYLVERFYLRLLLAISGLEQSFAGTVNPAFAASDLRQLWQDVGHVQDLMISSDRAWFDTSIDLVPALSIRIDSLPAQSALVDRAEFRRRFTEGFQAARLRHLNDLSGAMALLSRSLPAPVDSLGRPLPESETRIDLAPRLGELRAALADLLNRGFMVPTGGVDSRARPTLGGRPTWNVGPLEEALDYFGEYQDFRSGALSGVPPELRGLVLNVAGRSLEERVRWSLGRAMTFELGVGPEGRAGLEEDLRTRLASFDQAARRLVGMLELDDQLGGTPAGSAVAEAIILEGSDLLSEIDLLLRTDRLYEPINGNLAVWRGVRPASLAGFGVRDTEGLEAYLARQRESLASLSEYAAPVLGYLSLQPVVELLRYDGQGIAPDTDDLIDRWRNIVRTLDEYENKAPGNSLEALEQFVRQDMGIATLSQCTGVAGGTVPAANYFESVRARLSLSLATQCRELARMALLDGYQQLSSFHAERLVGRFPFADLLAQPDAPDADVEAVVEFLELWDRITEPLDGDPVQIVENLLGNEVSVDFFRQMAGIRALLGPVVFPDEEGVAGTLDVRTRMRTNRGSELGADQIVEWRLRFAGESVTYRGVGGTGQNVWRMGDVVSLSLTWASESARRPVRQPGVLGMSVDDATVTWRYAGPWALLRLIMANRPDPSSQTGDPVIDRATVNPRIVTRARDAVSESADPTQGVASVFIQLGLRPTSGGGDLVFPRFPTRPPPPVSR